MHLNRRNPARRLRTTWGKPGRSLRRWQLGHDIEASQEEPMKCHYCKKGLPEKGYNVVLYAAYTKLEDVPVCVQCLKTNHNNKASRMEKI